MDRLRIRQFLFFTWILNFSCIREVNSACTFPSSLQGTWYHSYAPDITISSTEIIQYYLPGIKEAFNLKPDLYTLECEIVQGDVYVVKTPTKTTINGNDYYIAMCLDFRSITANKKLIYYEGTVKRTDFNERVKVWLQSMYDSYVSGGTLISEACDDNAFLRLRTYRILVETGASVADVSISCPFPATDSDYSSSECTTPGTVDWQLISTSPTQLTLNNTNCGNQQGFSGTETLYCIYNVAEGSANYLATYNPGDTYDGSTTYRFSCIAYLLSGTDYTNTQHPEYCLGNQTEMEVTSPGIQFNLTYIVPTTTTSTTTPTTTTTEATTTTSPTATTDTTTAAPTNSSTDSSSSSDTLWIILGAVLGALLMLFILGMIIGLLCWRCNRKKSSSVESLTKETNRQKKPDSPDKQTRRHSLFVADNYGYGFPATYHPPSGKQPVPPPSTILVAPPPTKTIPEVHPPPKAYTKKPIPKKTVTKKKPSPSSPEWDAKPVKNINMTDASKAHPTGLYKDFFKTNTLSRVRYVNKVKRGFLSKIDSK